MTKVGFVGAGTIGANSIFATLAMTDRIDEIAVVDIAEPAAVGRAMDLNTASVAFGRRTRVHGGTDYALLKGCELVVVSAGVPRKPGMTRADLLGINIKILKSVCAEVKRHAPDCVFLLVSNPVDILLYICWKALGFPRERTIGMDPAKPIQIGVNPPHDSIREPHRHEIGHRWIPVIKGEKRFAVCRPQE